MNILIVEDQLEVLECLRLYFAGRGNEVRTACTAEEALRHLSQGPFDLAFVDLLLPQGHGRDVIRELRKRGQAPFPAQQEIASSAPAGPPRNDGEGASRTRVIVVTGCDDLELRRELLALGVADYLYKPVTVRDLDALFEGQS
jgi:DNA-binding response OmpR family regulator